MYLSRTFVLVLFLEVQQRGFLGTGKEIILCLFCCEKLDFDNLLKKRILCGYS